MTEKLTFKPAYAGFVFIAPDFSLWALILTKDLIQKNTPPQLPIIFQREGTPLGVSFYNLGLLQQMSLAISHITSNISPGYSLSVIYNIIGDLYWLTGDIHQAIECHIKSGTIANNLLKESSQEIDLNQIRANIGNMKVVAFVNIGLCQIDLWEIPKALDSFEKAISIATEIKCHKDKYIDTANFCLALLNTIDDLLSLHGKKYSRLAPKS